MLSIDAFGVPDHHRKEEGHDKDVEEESCVTKMMKGMVIGQQSMVTHDIE